MAKITRLRITNFRGIATLDVAVPAAGAVISGGNAQGKTSVLKAIAAALGGEGLGPDAIRLGTDGAEILVDLDALRIRRGITAKGASLIVKNGDGFAWDKPQSRLTELLGTAALDPLAFFEADAKERRRLVLEAMPLAVTREDFERWGVGMLGAPRELDGHGLEVLERVRKRFYDDRTAANRATKEAFDALSRARAELPAAPVKCPSTVEEAGEALTALETRRDEIAGRASAAEKAKLGTAATRQRIDELKAIAAARRQEAMAAPTRLQVDVAFDIRGAREADVVAARAALQRAEAAFAEADAAFQMAHAGLEKMRSQLEAAEKEERQAGDLEQSIAAVADLAVSQDEIALAGTAVEAADAVLKLAIENAAHASHVAHVETLAAAHEAARTAAEALDALVKTLTDVAPRELAGRAEMIPGLALTDAGLALDGVALDSLSGAEQLRFAVDLARRLNAKSRIVVCDGLERLDAGRLAEFVKFATADSWQLLATRVSEGELVVEAIEPEEAAS